MASLFDQDANSNVAYYADGTHGTNDRINLKVNLWGKRAEEMQPIRTYLAYDNENSKYAAGFVNFGLSSALLNGKKLFEGGLMFSSNYNNSPYVTEAINSVYVELFKKLHDDGVLKDVKDASGTETVPAFIYTISKDNPHYSAHKQSNEKEIVLDNNLDNLDNHYNYDPAQDCILQALRNEPNQRFVIDLENATITENGKEKAVFFVLLDDSICAPQKLEVTEDVSAEHVEVMGSSNYVPDNVAEKTEL
jgi:hypothetical protein